MARIGYKSINSYELKCNADILLMLGSFWRSQPMFCTRHVLIVIPLEMLLLLSSKFKRTVKLLSIRFPISRSLCQYSVVLLFQFVNLNSQLSNAETPQMDSSPSSKRSKQFEWKPVIGNEVNIIMSRAFRAYYYFPCTILRSGRNKINIF